MNFRRILSACAASAVLALAPLSGAVAYQGADETVATTETNPDAGEPFNVEVDAGADSPEATLTVSSDDPAVGDDDIEIAGSQSMTKATTDGVAQFDVTLYVEGTYALVGTDASGQVVGESTVVVGDGAAAGDTAAGVLPDTGSDATTMVLAAGGGLLLLGGAVALLLSRRRGAHAG